MRQKRDEISIIRSLMILWIYVTHYYEAFWAGAFMGNPNSNWPNINERLAQFAPIRGEGLFSFLFNIFRYAGLLGDQGVQVFFVISGFVLSMGYLESRGTIKYNIFYHKRFVRVYPAWVISHLVLMLLSLVSSQGLSPFSIKTWLSIAGLRILPSLFYLGSPSWWFIGCLLQLYLIFPIVYNKTLASDNRKRLYFFLLSALFIRFLGLLLLNSMNSDYLDMWSRGIWFFSRFPEFFSGVLVAYYFQANKERFQQLIKSVYGLIISFSIWLIGNICSFFLIGMTVSFIFTGLGAFLFLWGILLRVRNSIGTLILLSSISYEFYLTHYAIIIIIGKELFKSIPYHFPVFLLIFFLTVLFAIIMHKVVNSCIVVSVFNKIWRIVSHEYKRNLLVLILLFLMLLTIEHFI